MLAKERLFEIGLLMQKMFTTGVRDGELTSLFNGVHFKLSRYIKFAVDFISGSFTVRKQHLYNDGFPFYPYALVCSKLI